jgi:1,4-dihydroxy-2-naphthoyl-CoA hydrolase
MDHLVFIQQNPLPFATLLVVQFLSTTPERVVAQMHIREELCTIPAVAHGGVLMALAVTLGGCATALNLNAGHTTKAIGSKTNSLAPAPAGSTATAESVAVHRGKRMMVWQTRVTREDGTVVAVVTQTQMVLEPRLSPQETMAKLFEGKSLTEQKTLLATLERSGAALYHAFASNEADPHAREALLAAAAWEEENARLLTTSASVSGS